MPSGPVTATQASSLSSIATSPLVNFKFEVEFNLGWANIPTATLGFMEVSGLGVTINPVEFMEGGSNTVPIVFPSQAQWDPVVLSKGLMPGDSPFLSWFNELFSLMQGDGTGAQADYRANYVDIKLLDHPATTAEVNVKALWRLYGAWPSRLLFNSLNAHDNSILITQLTLRHQGWQVFIAPTFNTSAPDPGNA